MVGTIPRRGCAALLTVLVVSLVGLAGAPAEAETETVPLSDAVLYYTAEDGLSRIGGPDAALVEVADARSVALDDDGRVYVLSESDRTVRELERDGDWGTPLFPATTDISDVAARGGQVVVADPAARSLTVKAAGGEPVKSLFQQREPEQVVSTGDALYFVDRSGMLYRPTAQGEAEPLLADPLVSSLAADSNGRLYLGLPTKIVRYDPTTRQSADVLTGLSNAPVDLAVSESGDVYYATSGGDILRVQTVEGPSELLVSGVEGLTGIAVRTVPGAPAKVAAEGGEERATVFWSPSEKNGGPSSIRYRVTTFADDVRVDGAVCVSSEDMSCTVEGLSDGTSYRFEVTALNTADGVDTGSSAPARTNSVVPGPRPAAPDMGTPVAGNEAASVLFTPGALNGAEAVDWQTSTDRLEWREAEVLPTAGDEIETVVTELVNDETNSLYVRAVDAETRVTGDVGSAEVTPDGSLPGVPKNLVARPGEKSATLIFEPGEEGGSAITEYEVSVGGGAWTEVETVEGVPADSPPVSESPTVTPSETTAPAPDPEPAEEPGSSEEGEGGEQVAQGSGDVEPPGPVRSVVLEDLTEPITVIRLRAANGQGAGVFASVIVEPGGALAPGTPRILDVHPRNGQLLVVFQPGPGSVGRYEVQLGEDGDWKPLTLDQLGTPGIEGGIIGGLANGVTYEVRVRGVNDAGEGKASAPVSGTPASVSPDVPSSQPSAAEPTVVAPTTTPPSTEPAAEPTNPPVNEPTAGSTTTPPKTEPAAASTTTPPKTEPAAEPTTPATTTPATEEPTTPATTTAPATTAPVTTTPTTTEPVALTPAATTAPATTAPATTAPATTAPATTAPATTAPATTAPTTPPTTAPAPVVPLAPGGVNAAAGLASITVSWSAPAGNGAQITGYRATASPGGASCTSSGVSCVVGGDAGTSYTVSVVALSTAGASPASAPSNAVSPTELTVPAVPPVTDVPLETPDGPITSAAPGGKLKMSGSGYAPFSVVTLAVYSEPLVLGTVTADANGAFETEIDVPDNLSLGKHSFVAAGVDKNGKFRAQRLDLTVAEAAGEDEADDGKRSLPVTGSAVLWMLVAGFASVGSGVAVRRLVN